MSRLDLTLAEEDALVDLLTAYLATEMAQEDLPILRTILAKLDPTCECGHRIGAHPRRRLQIGTIPAACSKCGCDLYRAAPAS